MSTISDKASTVSAIVSTVSAIVNSKSSSATVVARTGANSVTVTVPTIPFGNSTQVYSASASTISWEITIPNQRQWMWMTDEEQDACTSPADWRPRWEAPVEQ